MAADALKALGAAVGVAVVTLGIGALLLLVKTKKHYVGIVWAEKAESTAAIASGVAPTPPSTNAAASNAPSPAASTASSKDPAKGGVSPG